MEAITPDQNNFVRGPIFDSAVLFLNEAISSRRWHNQFVKVDNYHAIILYPLDHYNSVMDEVVKEFKSKGWDCYWARAYDARGPHYCFYVHEKHF